MKTNVFELVWERRELTIPELIENFNSARYDIYKATNLLRFYIQDPNTLPHAIPYDHALKELGKIISEFESLRFSVQDMKNQDDNNRMHENRLPDTKLANKDVILNITQVAEFLHCSRSTVYRKHLKAGLKSHLDVNGKTKVKVSDLAEYDRNRFTEEYAPYEIFYHPICHSETSEAA